MNSPCNLDSLLNEYLEAPPKGAGQVRSERWAVRCRQLADRARGESSLSSDEAQQLLLWVRKQRKRMNRGELSPIELRCLACTGGWSLDPREDAWDDGFKELKTFVQGHGRLPRSTKKDASERRIYDWHRRNRVAAANGTLPYLRAQTLDSLPLPWR